MYSLPQSYNQTSKCKRCISSNAYETQKDKKAYTLFRKNLQKDGFTMFQFSIYVRHCASYENAEVHIKRVKSFLPEFGQIGILCITDKQFSQIELFYGKKPQIKNVAGQQLELF